MNSFRVPIITATISGCFVAAAGLFVVVGGANSAATSKFRQLDPGEAFPGGAATSRKSTNHRDAFSHASHGMGFEREAQFRIGNAIFRRLWIAAPASTDSADGLGPLYNARGCQNCHLKDGRGRPPAANWPDEQAVSMFLRLSIPPQTEEQNALLARHRVNVIPEPVYGGQLQNFATPGLDAEGHMHITYTERDATLADGTIVKLRAPTYSVTELGYGPLHPQVMMSPRIAPPMIGLGLLEAVPEERLLSLADPDDANGDGISGRVNRVWSTGKDGVTIGRFGWKAGTATIREQSADAAAGDIGLSSPLAPRAFGDCTKNQEACLAAPNGNSERAGGHELSAELLDLVTFYSQNLAVPRRREPSAPLVLEGKSLFHAAGCAGCHTPSHTTGKASKQPYLSGQKIWPYTDLLLHDMGPGLADGRPEGDATGREWRTAPLWGIGLTETVNGHTFFLHDGRARSVEEAILWHGGEAQTSRDAYAALSKAERDALLAFVNSL